ncbi:MAG: hypothetical protein ACXABY_03770 [Candidatus Thorarchaeota archaeon]|jgi:hypothetical protein
MDYREIPKSKAIRFDHDREEIILYPEELGEIKIPAEYILCDVCEGRGTHVHPGIDSHGISLEEFSEDPEFREDYFSGRYDVTCNECDGMRVVLIPDETRCSPEDLEVYHSLINFEYEYWMEQQAEIRMGA